MQLTKTVSGAARFWNRGGISTFSTQKLRQAKKKGLTAKFFTHSHHLYGQATNPPPKKKKTQ